MQTGVVVVVAVVVVAVVVVDTVVDDVVWHDLHSTGHSLRNCAPKMALVQSASV